VRRALIILIGALLAPGGGVSAETLDEVAVRTFISHMVSTHRFQPEDLKRVFENTQRSENILTLMRRPAEKVKEWSEYRPIFITSKRIQNGVSFWNRNEESLKRAFAVYGVTPEVIVAIIGIETSYGRISGGHRVVDALATLAFHYPDNNARRSKFFLAQLEEFLLLTREDQVDPLGLSGSYAGAMGIPQFMPESYRKLAVDFDGDGVRDIWTNPSDAIGSVANYLNHHGWRKDGPVIAHVVKVKSDPARFLKSSIRPTFRLNELISGGIVPAEQDVNGGEKAALFKLRGSTGNEFWIGYTNFYVISRYNPRVKYSMAVAQLAEAIKNSRDNLGT